MDQATIKNPDYRAAVFTIGMLADVLSSFLRMLDDPNCSRDDVRAPLPAAANCLSEQLELLLNYVTQTSSQLKSTTSERDEFSVQLNQAQQVLGLIWAVATDRKYDEESVLPVEILNAVVAMRSHPDSDLLDLMEAGLFMHTEDVKTESQGWVRAWVAAFNGKNGEKIRTEAPTVRALLRSVLAKRDEEIKAAIGIVNKAN